MSSTKYYRNGWQRAFVGHCCSRCGNPVINEILIHGHSVVNSSITNNANTAEEILKEAISNRLLTISSCQVDKKRLVSSSKDYDIGMLRPGRWVYTYVFGLDASCPLCSKQELWQLSFDEHESMWDMLKPENYPQVFDSLDNALTYANKALSDIIYSANNSYKEHKKNMALDIIRKRYSNLPSMISDLEQQRENLPEQWQLSQLDQAIEKKQLEKKEVGYFHSAKRKAIELEIVQLSKERSQLQKTLDSNKLELQKQVILLSREYYSNILIMGGCSGNTDSIQISNRIATKAFGTPSNQYAFPSSTHYLHVICCFPEETRRVNEHKQEQKQVKQEIQSITKQGDDIPENNQETIPTLEKHFNTLLAPLSGKLRRAFIFIEDEDWDRANEYFEEALDDNPENPYAYLGKALISAKVCSFDSVSDKERHAVCNTKEYNRALMYADENSLEAITWWKKV